MRPELSAMLRPPKEEDLDNLTLGERKNDEGMRKDKKRPNFFLPFAATLSRLGESFAQTRYETTMSKYTRKFFGTKA